MKKCNGCLGCKNHSIRGIKSRLSNTEKWETKNATFHIQALLVVSIHVNATVVWNTVVKHPMRLKEDMLYASGMLCPHNATHLKKVWKSCQTLHATVVDVYKIDKIVNRIQVSFQSEVKDLPKLLGTWLMDRCSEVFELNIEPYINGDNRWEMINSRGTW